MTALVLSAGGLYCAYQAGAYKAITEWLQPDLVTGASAGALNGWPIAAGCSPDQLIQHWLEPETSDLLPLRRKPNLLTGYFSTHRLHALCRKLIAEFSPRMPFGLTVVEALRLRTILVQHPHVTAQHLEATCSIPLFLPAVRIGGVRYVDGGLIEKLPIQAAIQMGANRIIAIDSLTEAGIWWLRAGTSIVRGVRPKRRIPTGIEVLTITPSQSLGDTRSAVMWNRDEIERRIELGYRDTSRIFSEGRNPFVPLTVPGSQ